MNFQGKSVIVTGGSSGIGRDIAVEFARRGANVTVNFASSEAKARETLELLEKAGGRGVLAKGDVSVEQQVETVVGTAADAFGGVDVLVNNAGRTAFVPFDRVEDITGKMWQDILGVNVVGTFFVARAAARHMKERGGSIINVASIAGHRPNGSSIPYCTSKSAILMLTKCLAKGLGPKVRVNSVSPGYIAETGWNDSRSPEDTEAAVRHATETAAVKRTGIPDDIVGAVLYLASDASSFCSGMDILVDGGRSLFV